MKKTILSVLLLTQLISISSCSNNKPTIFLDQIDNVDSFIYIEDQELVELISHKKDFALTIGLKGCESCNIIKPIINNYIKENNTPFYYIDIDEYKEAVSTLKDDEIYSLKGIVFSASLLLFDEGIDIKYIEYQDSLYQSNDSFKKEIKKYITHSGYSLINDYSEFTYQSGEKNMYKKNTLTHESLQKLINSNQKVSVLFSWLDCPDCTLLIEEFLDEYLEKNNDKKLYFFEVKDIRLNEDSTIWEDFKVKYQFNNYREGRVPSIVTYENGQKDDMAVFVNDLIEEIANGFKITDSFWKDIIGLEGKTKEELRLKAAEKEYHYIEEYLNKHL